MAVSVVDIQVNSQGAVRALRQTTAASRELESAVGNQTKQIQTAANGMRYFTDAAGRARAENGRFLSTAEKAAAGLNKEAAAVNGLGGAIGKLLGAFALISSAKFVFVSAAEIETQTKSIAVLTGSVDKAKQIISELQALGAVTPFTSAELIDTAKRLNAFGVATEKVVETTRRLADVSGATGAELQGLATAYGQVQAKGRLQGEELLQFQERGIALQGELRKMYGMTGEEFQKALAKGRISAEAVEVALQRLTDAGGKYANGAIAQSDTLNGKLSTLQDSFQRLAANIGTFFAPAFKFLISKTDELINRLNRGAFGVQAEMQQRAGAERLSRAGVTERTYKDAQGNVYSTITGRLVQAAKPRIATATGKTGVPALLGETGGSASTGASKPKTEKKPKDFTEQIANSKTALNLANLQFAAEGKILEARRLTNEPLVLALTAQKEIYKIDADVAKIKADKEMPSAQKLNEIAALEVQRKTINRQLTYDIATAEQTASQTRLQAITAYLEKQYELNTAIQQQNALAESVSSTLGQGMTAVFDSLIKGSDNWGASLQQIASSVLVDIANQLIRIYVIEQAVSAIKSFLSPSLPFGGGGGMIGGVGTLGPNYGIRQRALGGPVTAGSPYLVGERGPELFMPSRGGSIIPNNALGGGGTSVVVNVDASGSSVQGDQAQGKQLGVAISAAVQAELVKQQRPGGLLAGTR